MFTRPFPLDGNDNGWLANAGNIINSHNLIPGTGVSLHKTPNGIQISVNGQRQINYVVNKGYYSFSNEYWPGDIVYVDPNGTYTDQSGSTITGIAFGGFICTTYVPPSQNTSTLFLGSVVPQLTANGGQGTDYMANTYRWYGLNNYYPVTPTSGSGTLVVSVSGYNIYASQSFWQPIGGAGGSITWTVYDENAGYAKGTLVWVDPAAHYSRSFYDTGSGNAPPLSAGCFITLRTVPPAVSGSRPSGNNVWPFYPPIPDSAKVTVSGSDYNVNYFGAITPLSPFTFCNLNGITETGFGVFIPTGSAYAFALPYP